MLLRKSSYKHINEQTIKKKSTKATLSQHNPCSIAPLKSSGHRATLAPERAHMRHPPGSTQAMTNCKGTTLLDRKQSVTPEGQLEIDDGVQVDEGKTSKQQERSGRAAHDIDHMPDRTHRRERTATAFSLRIVERHPADRPILRARANTDTRTEQLLGSSTTTTKSTPCHPTDQTRAGQEEPELHGGASKKEATRASPTPGSTELVFSPIAGRGRRQRHDDAPREGVALVCVTIAGADRSGQAFAHRHLHTTPHLRLPTKPRKGPLDLDLGEKKSKTNLTLEPPSAASPPPTRSGNISNTTAT
jgi:hypothetical protein